jgi:alpha-tubulin suppressor-like RCC1 family protein
VDTATLTIQQAVWDVVLTPDEDTLTALDETYTFNVTATDRNDNPIVGQTFSWLSSDEGVASIDPSSGLITALANGSTEITATVAGRSDVATLIVSQAVSSVDVTPAAVKITAIGLTSELNAVANDANDNEVAGETFDWSSSDESVATVDAAGLATAVGDGMATITATADGVDGTADLTVEVRFETVSAGSVHTCAVTTTGVPYCWGSNSDGQLGDNTTEMRGGPVPVVTSSDYVMVSAGSSHTCGLLDDNANCWGDGRLGKLGIGSEDDQHTPAQVTVPWGFTYISAGGGHSCAVAETEAAHCWGSNEDGQVGDPTWQFNWLLPNLVAGGHDYFSVSAGGFHSCGVTTGNLVLCWGWNPYGQLGDGTIIEKATPVQLDHVPPLGATQVATGWNHSCALSLGGTIYCWGRNHRGQLGATSFDLCEDDPCAKSPVSVSGLSVTSVTAGNHHTCGVTSGGVAYCWGENSSGQLGNGNAQDQPTPSLVTGGLSFASLDAGGDHTCGVTLDGLIYCWGSNFSGQLGTGQIGGGSFAPVRVLVRPH